MERPIRRLIQRGLLIGSLALMGCEASSYGPRMAKDGCVEGASWTPGLQGHPIGYRICKLENMDHAIQITTLNRTHPGRDSLIAALVVLGGIEGCEERVEARQGTLEAGNITARVVNRDLCWRNLTASASTW